MAQYQLFGALGHVRHVPNASRTVARSTGQQICARVPRADEHFALVSPQYGRLGGWNLDALVHLHRLHLTAARTARRCTHHGHGATARNGRRCRRGQRGRRGGSGDWFFGTISLGGRRSRCGGGFRFHRVYFWWLRFDGHLQNFHLWHYGVDEAQSLRQSGDGTCSRRKEFARCMEKY